ncbi:MAG: sodium:solute symporter family protein [Deltaproteobacteria bacterium]|nr:sodium:solute symporter family protein [Deltaproteobacteria bacterium]
MAPQDSGLGFDALIILSLYLLSNIFIGYFAYRSGETWHARDYFLGGKSTGALVLFFAMLATKFSGNTFFGLPGQSYRVGLMAVTLIPFTIAISLGFLTYAPRLYVLSKKYDYLTPSDYYADRFDSRVLRLWTSVFLILTVIPYLMIQTTAMGHAFVGFTGGRYTFATGVIYIFAGMLIYVLLSGWRGVVWAEVLQGGLLWLAIVVAAVVLVRWEGGLAAVIQQAVTVAPEKIAVPDSFATLTRSYLLLALVFGFGGSMYPQIIQSVYAAKSEKALRRGLAMMIPNYFIVMLAVVLIGLVGIIRLHDLKTIEADQVLAQLLSRQAESAYWIAILVFLGAAAAIMSTAAGVLLTLSSMVTHDLYRQFVRPQANEEEIAIVGRGFTVAILILVTLLSLHPIATLWQLTLIKFEFLMQLYLPMILGLYWPRFTRTAAIVGLAAGTVSLLAMVLTSWKHIGVFDAGVTAFLINIVVSVVVTLLKQPSTDEQQRVQERFFALFEPKAPAQNLTPVSSQEIVHPSTTSG